MGSSKSKSDALEILRQWRMTRANPLSTTTEQQVLCVALRIETQNDWNFMFEKYLQAVDSDQEIPYLGALGCSEDPEIIRNFLDLALTCNSSVFASPLFVYFDVYTSGNAGLNTTLQYMASNLTDIANGFSVSSLLSWIANYLYTEEHFNYLSWLVNLKLTYPAYETEIDNATSVVRSNIEEASIYLSSIIPYYENDSDGPPVADEPPNDNSENNSS